jgi:hypothetical protein
MKVRLKVEIGADVDPKHIWKEMGRLLQMVVRTPTQLILKDEPQYPCSGTVTTFTETTPGKADIKWSLEEDNGRQR